jgi:hypothetical protein
MAGTGRAGHPESNVPEEAGPFYPVGCHPPLLTRRQLLGGGGAALAAGVFGVAPAWAGDDGTAVVRRFAGLPDDPWAVCHGVRAMGRDFKLTDGRRAVDWLLETYVAVVPASRDGILAFPLQVEVHPNMFVKTFLEAGVPLDYGFTHQGQRRTLAEVVEGARLLFRPSQVMSDPNLLPWSLIALTRTTAPLRGRWTNAWGEPVDLDRVVEASLRLLEDASLPLAQAMRENRPESVKAPVHGFVCGGTHMIYALLTAAQAGYASGERLHRIRKQADILVWRLAGDLGLIDRFYKEQPSLPGVHWFQLQAKLKLLGHGQECMAFGTQHGVVKLTPAQQERWREAVATLKRTIEDIEGRDIIETRKIDRELFRQLIGDACHARHGLTLT